MSTRTTVRVMTWNIHGALGRNPRFDLARVAALVEAHDPDLVALQEIDSRRPRDGVEPFAFLQQALGHYGLGAKSIVTKDGEYGQMLLSRWLVRRSHIHDISFPEREPRRAIEADLRTPLGPLHVVATHLGLSLRERRSQVRTLRELIGRTEATTLVMGDFNDWFWAGSVRSVLARVCPGRTGFRTFPARLPLLRLDRIFCRPADALVSAFTDGTAAQLSDHLPVIADIRPTAR